MQFMGLMMKARFGLIFLVCVSFAAPGYDIAKKCKKQYDLTFRLTGYNCVFYGAGMFYYKDKHELDRIYFNSLPVGAGILIDTELHVKTISIGEGDLRLCSNVHTPSGVTNVNNIPSSSASVPTSSTKNKLDITGSMETTTVDKKTSQLPSIRNGEHGNQENGRMQIVNPQNVHLRRSSRKRNPPNR
ncbi:unnamed protein product [Mytilus coruscus]|uniref:Uncharacterized protein n=1 Tax=Mytilus coruscus TaxID=42192 RepID=A0A6J8ESB9_MYTCO|nr:unnamed protein product [Mytilus coruscus]